MAPPGTVESTGKRERRIVSEEGVLSRALAVTWMFRALSGLGCDQGHRAVKLRCGVVSPERQTSNVDTAILHGCPQLHIGLPEQQTTTYTHQAGTNFITSITDALGRRTDYTFDALGNRTSMTHLAGTPDAMTTTYTYEPTFNQVASITDHLNHTLLIFPKRLSQTMWCVRLSLSRSSMSAASAKLR